MCQNVALCGNGLSNCFSIHVKLIVFRPIYIDNQFDKSSSVECQMGEWSEFGECSKLCDGGVQEKTRSITKLADDCDQLNDTEEKECNTHPCEGK